jgi:hypothetical protein
MLEIEIKVPPLLFGSLRRQARYTPERAEATPTIPSNHNNHSGETYEYEHIKPLIEFIIMYSMQAFDLKLSPLHRLFSMPQATCTPCYQWIPSHETP